MKPFFRFTCLCLFFLAGLLGCKEDLPERHPVSLRDDIKLERFMKVGPGCVRLLQDPVSKDLFYTTFSGDVFRIKKDIWGKPYSEQVLSFEDHGIKELQGAAFLDSTLFLIGNTPVKKGLATRGIGMRADLQPNGKRALSILFLTAEIGGNKTIFDHGFNGIVVSPDKKYLFINSGARTDHGELQDNGGLFPGLRNGNLTACIFRIPSNSQMLYLPDDHQFLKENGYLYAEGIRNAYDLAFDGKGNLFAVSNSGDYDHSEDMFWLREGHHYGFPWVMGNTDNPQRFPDWQPDAATDSFIPPTCHAWLQRYFHNDPDFPLPPDSVTFTKPLLNTGPDANIYRDKATGKVMDADSTGVLVGTFTAHRSPLGLFFDVDNTLAGDLKGDGFVLSWTDGESFPLMQRISPYGEDLLHLELTYVDSLDNYYVKTTRIVDNFLGPTDALLIDNVAYVIEYNARRANIWKVIFPTDKH